MNSSHELKLSLETIIDYQARFIFYSVHYPWHVKPFKVLHKIAMCFLTNSQSIKNLHNDGTSLGLLWNPKSNQAHRIIVRRLTDSIWPKIRFKITLNNSGKLCTETSTHEMNDAIEDKDTWMSMLTNAIVLFNYTCLVLPASMYEAT